MLACLTPHLRVVVRLLLVAGHQPYALAKLAARHIQVRELVHATERTGHVALHGRAQRHRTGAVVAADMRIGGGRTLVDGDVDRLPVERGLVLVRRQHVAVHVAVALRREAR